MHLHLVDFGMHDTQMHKALITIMILPRPYDPQAGPRWASHRRQDEIFSGLVLIKACGIGRSKAQGDALQEQIFRRSSRLDIKEPAQVLTWDFVYALKDAGDYEDRRSVLSLVLLAAHAGVE